LRKPVLTILPKTLDIFNFGDSIKKWIKVYYNNIDSSVIQCGFLSTFFLQLTVPYIFMLCTEILIRKIKQNQIIKSINVGGIEHIISQYAEDASCQVS
jgi:hypothetical protein